MYDAIRIVLSVVEAPEGGNLGRGHFLVELAEIPYSLDPVFTISKVTITGHFCILSLPSCFMTATSSTRPIYTCYDYNTFSCDQS